MLLCFYVNLRCCTTSFMDSLFMRTPIGGMDLRQRDRAAGATHVQISWISAWIPSEVTQTFFFDLPIWDSNSNSFSCRSFSSQREPTVVGSIKLCCYVIRSTRSFSGSQQPLGWPQVNPALCRWVRSAPRTASIESVGYDFSCGSYQTNSEQIMLFGIAYIKLTCLYILTITFLSDRKSVGRNDSHIFCARPCHFSLRGWRHGSPGKHAHLHRRRHAQKCKYHTHCCPSIFATASLTTWAVDMKNALFVAIKISKFGKWVERHNGDHLIHVTSDDVTGDRKRGSKGGTTITMITRARDEKGRIGNMVMSAGMNKSVNTNFIQKSFLLNSVNQHKGVIAQIKTFFFFF